MQLWDVTNYTPFAAFGGFERDHTAESYWCVWVKARFFVSPDGHVSWRPSKAMQIQPGPKEIKTDGGPLMIEEADLSLPKSATDITLHGEALVPARQAGISPIALKVGNWSKSLELHPPVRMRGRKAVADMPPAEATTLPLDWRSTFGGVLQDAVFEANPMGTGYAPDGKNEDDFALPRIAYPGQQISKASHEGQPASFLPVPRSWMPRRKLAGTFDDEWAKTRAPLLPKDHSIDYRSAVPPDQRYNGFLQGGEPVEMRGIAWAGGVRAPAFRLPQLDFEVQTRYDGTWHPMKLRPQTLVLSPSEASFTVLWSAALPIGSTANDVKVQQSTIVLKGSGGFTVEAGDAEKFGMENPAMFKAPDADEPDTAQAVAQVDLMEDGTHAHD